MWHYVLRVASHAARSYYTFGPWSGPGPKGSDWTKDRTEGFFPSVHNPTGDPKMYCQH